MRARCRHDSCDDVLVADERDDVEVAWARIVADYDREVDDPVGRWPAQEDVPDPAGDPTARGRRETDLPASRLEADLVDEELGGSATDSRIEDADDTGRDAGAGSGTDPTPLGEIDRDESEHHFVPPVPPPLGRPDLPTGLAWAGVLGGPVLLLVATALGWALPQLLTAACILGFIGGLVFLVATMDDDHGRDGWDDGAQV